MNLKKIDDPLSFYLSQKSGKDEMNISEFPISTLSDKISSENKLAFRDNLMNKETGKIEERVLEVFGSVENGLPRFKDDEVIRGLIQLSSKLKFNSRTIRFSRYELIKILDWNLSEYSYNRVKQSLLLWTEVSLKYKGSWRDPEQKKWKGLVSFHIIESFRIIDKDEKEKGSIKEYEITWNDIFFNSMCGGNLKNIDYKFFKSLKLPIAKRMYLFLDKCFWRKNWQVFDLSVFAYEKIGISRKICISQVKSKLENAITELEDENFITRIDKKKRFKRVRKGIWEVIFVKKDTKDIVIKPTVNEPKKEKTVSNPIIQLLLDFKISKKKSSELVKKYPEKILRKKINTFKDSIKRGKSFNNPTGFLISSIEEEYMTPGKYINRERVNSKDHELQIKETERYLDKERAHLEEVTKERKQKNTKLEKIKKHLDSLPELSRKLILDETFKGLDEFEKKSIFIKDGLLIERFKEMF